MGRSPEAGKGPERVVLASARPRTVGELMRRRFIALSPHDSLRDAGELMRFARVRQLPVVDGDDRLIGALSQQEVLSRSLAAALESGAEEARRALRVLSVRGVVVASPPTLTPDASLSEAVESLLDHPGGFVAVVEHEGDGARLLGLVTESDLLRCAIEGGWAH